MPDSRRASLAPWFTAGIAFVVAAVLALVFFGLLLPYKRDHPVGEFTSTERAAVGAAATEIANLLTYRRAHFDADYQRAVDGTTGPLKSDVEGKKATTKKALTTGKFDLSAQVSHEALVGPATKANDGNGYVVLVTVNGYKSTAPNIPNQQSLKVTVVKVGGKWLANDVESVGVA